MALAPFIRKAALGASQLLSGVTPEKFEAILTNCCAGIALGHDAEDTIQGRYLSDLLVNMISRLYPKLVICGDDETSIDRLKLLATSINPNIEFAGPEMAQAWVVIGDGVVKQSAAPVIYAGSNGWSAVIASHSATCGNTSNPFGAGAAACIASANLFRLIFACYLTDSTLDQNLSLCLFDYKVNDPACLNHPEPCGSFSMGTVLVGGGAIGNGALWALSRAPLSGVLDVVDPETVDDTNAQRYVLTDVSTTGSKVALAQEVCKSGALDITPHSCNWADFINGGVRCLSLVAVAVDTAQDRIEIQSSLPKSVLNAWTQAGDLGVSRHRFPSDQACLACLYLPPRFRPSEDLLVQQAIRYSGDLMQVRNMLYFDTPLDMTWIARIASDMKLSMEQVLPFLGRPLRDLYLRGICGGILLTVNEGDRSLLVEVPMAFQSALAGIMLASEMCLFAMGQSSAPPPVTTKINLMRPIGGYLSEAEYKHASGKCICQDPDYLNAYRSKYQA